MNKKIGLLVATATLAAGCDGIGQTNLEQVKNDLSPQIYDIISKAPDTDTVNYFESIEVGNKYDDLIQKIDAPIVS